MFTVWANLVYPDSLSFDGLGYFVLPGFKELESVERSASCFSLIPGYKVRFVMQMPRIKIWTMEEGEGVCY